MSDDDPDPAGPYRALIGLGAVVALIVAMLFIMYHLGQASKMQDCLASGRTNCAPIETPHQ